MRIVTRPDFDGIACAALLIEALNIKEPVHWVEPNHIHQGLVDIVKEDIIANLAYDQRCSLWFDHHSSNRIKESFNGSFKIAPSAARVVFEYYKKELKRDYTSLVRAADKIDSANLSLDEVLFPEKYPYILLDSTIPGFQNEDFIYWNRLAQLLRTTHINKILEDMEIQSRAQTAITENREYKILLKKNTKVIQHVSITNFLSYDPPLSGNRFLVFSLYPETSVNVKIRFDHSDKKKVISNIGHSIFNRTCNVDVGELCARYNGGGHKRAGSCNFPEDRLEEHIKTITDILVANKMGDGVKP